MISLGTRHYVWCRVAAAHAGPSIDASSSSWVAAGQ